MKKCSDCPAMIGDESTRCRVCNGRVYGRISPGLKPMFGEKALTGAEKSRRHRNKKIANGKIMANREWSFVREMLLKNEMKTFTGLAGDFDNETYVLLSDYNKLKGDVVEHLTRMLSVWPWPVTDIEAARKFLEELKK